MVSQKAILGSVWRQGISRNKMVLYSMLFVENEKFVLLFFDT